MSFRTGGETARVFTGRVNVYFKNQASWLISLLTKSFHYKLKM